MELFLEKLKRFGRREKIVRLRARLPELNFIMLHYLYFICVCLITSVIFYGSSEPGFSTSYTNSLFLVVSAMTEAGLNTVNLSTMTTFQQVMLWFLIIIGSSIWVSIFTVLTRKKYFESRFKNIVKRQKEAGKIRQWSMSEVHDRSTSQTRQDTVTNVEPADGSLFQQRYSELRDPTNQPSLMDPIVEKPLDPGTAGGVKTGSNDAVLVGSGAVKEAKDIGEKNSNADDISFMRYMPPSHKGPQRSRILSFAGVGVNPRTTEFKFSPTEGMTNRGSKRARNGHKHDNEEEIHYWQYPNYLTRHTTGRNGQIHGLSRKEREHLGGVEYRSITLLAYVVPIYFVLWQLLGCIGLGAYMAHNKASTAEENGISPWYVLFHW